LKKNRFFSEIILKKKESSALDTDYINQAEVIFICTEDSKIENVVKQLLSPKINLKKKYIFHISGALSSDVLNPLSTQGTYTGSFHPVQTFSKKAASYSGTFENIYIALEGNEKALQKGKKIASAVKSKYIVISKENKVFHHISCVTASNYLSANLNNVEEISKKIFKNGFNKTSFFGIYKPLIMQTMLNISQKGAVNSLTGPVERNDVKTIKLHLKSLSEKMPELAPSYSFMGIETVRLALKKKSITKNEAKNMIKLFTAYLTK
jgi:predicted short-subunit dehydrogenase-like oxidoreductase (DUF2520 family)